MKIRTKLLLSASAMFALTATAMSAATFAWFTATRQATVTFEDITVIARGGNLSVSFVDNGEDYDVDESVPNVVAIEGTEIITDISGDGVNFYKPAWLPGETGVAASHIDNVTALSGRFVEFQLEVSRDDGATDVNDGLLVYLGENTVVEPVTPANAADEDAVDSSRIALLDEAGDDVSVLWAQDDSDAGYEYLIANVGEVAYAIDDYELVDATAHAAWLAGEFEDHNLMSAGEASGGNSPVIADLSADSESVVITVRIWIEGTDEDCTDDAIDGEFKITLDIYALEFTTL